MPQTAQIKPIWQLGLHPVDAHENGKGTILAEDFVSYILLDPNVGSVLSVDKEHPEKVAFLYSSLDKFHRFNDVFQTYAREVVSLDDDQANALVSEVAKKMKVFDPEALSSPSHWWSMVIEQMELGQL